MEKRIELKTWELNDGFAIKKTKWGNQEKYDYVLRKDDKPHSKVNRIFGSFDEAVIAYIVAKYGFSCSMSETNNLIELVSNMFQIKDRLIIYDRTEKHE